VFVGGRTLPVISRLVITASTGLTWIGLIEGRCSVTDVGTFTGTTSSTVSPAHAPRHGPDVAPCGFGDLDGMVHPRCDAGEDS
jgi:hypothetical protein